MKKARAFVARTSRARARMRARVPAFLRMHRDASNIRNITHRGARAYSRITFPALGASFPFIPAERIGRAAEYRSAGVTCSFRLYSERVTRGRAVPSR